VADLYNGGNIRQCIDPPYGACSCGVINVRLLIGFDRYLQEFAVFVFNGKSETVEVSTSMLILVFGILVRCELVQELPGRSMQCKHAQEYDSQYFMYPVLFHSTVSEQQR